MSGMVRSGLAGSMAVCASGVLLFSLAAESRPLPARQVIAITEVNVIDVEQGRSLGPRTVLIDNGHISAITSPRAAAIPPGARRIPGRGKFLIPGLIDMHVHLFNLSSKRPPNDWSLPLHLANGVTGVREMRADAESMVLVNQWRNQIDEGALSAPRIVAAGIAVQGVSPLDAARQVAAAAEAGADFIKVFSEIPASHWRAVLNTANARALAVAGHVPAGVPIAAAADAGQRSNEHLMQAYEACSGDEKRWLAPRAELRSDALAKMRDEQEAPVLAAFDQAACTRAARALADTRQAQVPTLVLADEDSMQAAGKPRNDWRWRFLRADERTRWEKFLTVYTKEDAALAKARWPVARKIVRTFDQAGVTILAGTDAPMPGVYPGFSLHEEMGLLVAAGLAPAAALRAATIAPARFLDIANESGSIAVGKRADLILLDADPLKNIYNTRKIRAVVFDGRVLLRPALDGLLREVAAANPR